jgi:RNA polymerase sigma-70 factor (ECF subfamily)
MRVETLTIDSAVQLDRQDCISIYERHSAELFRYAYRLLGDRDLAEECVAETFSRFLHAISNGRGPVENIRAYLFRMAHNWATDQYRRGRLPCLSLEEEEHPDEGGNPSQIVQLQMDKERVRAALHCLPSEQRLVIELRFLEEWSHEEVAVALDKSTEATRALQHRALGSLRRMLVEQERDRC